MYSRVPISMWARDSLRIFLHKTSLVCGGGAGGPCLVVDLGSVVIDSFFTLSFPFPPSPSLLAGLVSPEEGREMRPPLPTPFSRGTCCPRLQFCSETRHQSLTTCSYIYWWMDRYPVDNAEFLEIFEQKSSCGGGREGGRGRKRGSEDEVECCLLQSVRLQHQFVLRGRGIGHTHHTQSWGGSQWTHPGWDGEGGDLEPLVVVTNDQGLHGDRATFVSQGSWTEGG